MTHWPPADDGGKKNSGPCMICHHSILIQEEAINLLALRIGVAYYATPSLMLGWHL